MYFTAELNGTRKVVKLSKNASVGQVSEAAFGNPDAKINIVIATKSLDIANGATCAVWPIKECACEICDPRCGKKGCVGFIRIHSADPMCA